MKLFTTCPLIVVMYPWRINKINTTVQRVFIVTRQILIKAHLKILLASCTMLLGSRCLVMIRESAVENQIMSMVERQR